MSRHATGPQGQREATSPPAARSGAPDEVQLLRAMVESVGDGIVVADSHGRFLYFNPAAEQILGMGQRDVPPQLWGETYGVYYPDTFTPFPADRMPLARAIRGEDTNQVELYIRNAGRPEGAYVSVTGRPLRNHEGIICGGVVVLRDISKRRQAEGELLHQRYLLKTLMDHLPDAIYFKDRDSRFTAINRALADRFGLADPAQAAGKTDADFFLEEHAHQSLDDERRVVETGKPIINAEEKETWRDGTVTWVSSTKM